jgi:hypothetical protein
MALAFVLEVLILGLVARLFVRRVYRYLPAGMTRSVWSLWGHLIIVWAVLNGLWILITWQAPALASPFLTGSRRILAFNFVALPFMLMGVLAVLYCALPAVAVYGDSALRALTRSFRLFLERPFTCFFLAAAVLVAPAVLAALIGNPGWIIGKFGPEMIYCLIIARLAAEMAAGFLWMGTAVYFLRDTEDLPHHRTSF